MLAKLYFQKKKFLFGITLFSIFLLGSCTNDNYVILGETDLTGKTYVLSCEDSEDHDHEQGACGTAYLTFNSDSELDFVSGNTPNGATYETDEYEVTINLLDKEVYGSSLVFEADECFSRLKITSNGKETVWKFDRKGNYSNGTDK